MEGKQTPSLSADSFSPDLGLVLWQGEFSLFREKYGGQAWSGRKSLCIAAGSEYFQN